MIPASIELQSMFPAFLVHVISIQHVMPLSTMSVCVLNYFFHPELFWCVEFKLYVLSLNASSIELIGYCSCPFRHIYEVV